MRKTFVVEVIQIQKENKYIGWDKETRKDIKKDVITSNLRVIGNDSNVFGSFSVEESLLIGQKFQITIDTTHALDTTEKTELPDIVSDNVIDGEYETLDKPVSSR